MLIYSSKSYMSEIYQHLVVQIEMTRMEYLIPKATFLTAPVFPGHWLVVLLLYNFIFIYFALFTCSILRPACPGCCSISISSVSEGKYLESFVWLKWLSRVEGARHAARIRLKGLSSRGRVMDLVQRGAPTVRRQTRQWKVGQSI